MGVSNIMEERGQVGMLVGQRRWDKAYRHLADTQGTLPEGVVEADRGVYHHHHLHLPPFMFNFAQCAHCRYHRSR
jgi:hypothetical protein